MAKKPSKGVKELKRIKAAARAAVKKVTDTNFAPGAHPLRGEIADEQIGATKDYGEADPLGSHDDS